MNSGSALSDYLCFTCLYVSHFYCFIIVLLFSALLFLCIVSEELHVFDMSFALLCFCI